MKTSFKITETFPATAKQLYEGWLDSQMHGEFTGGQAAKIDPREGGKFSVWDGYIFGKTVALEPFHRIVQSWRTTEFPTGAPDSDLEILFDDLKGKAMLTLVHTHLPPEQVEEYRQGWNDYYFKPMKNFFKSKEK
jgi:activator of HSP90 ATPase